MAMQPDNIKDLPEAEEEMPKQVRYDPRSSGRQIGSLIPQNQVSVAQTALSRLEQRQGNVDEFVRSRLNYDTVEDLQSRFYAEQIDSIALAVDNLEQGKGFIFADMTGQGKGCQCAGILRYAAQQGKITEHPKSRQTRRSADRSAALHLIPIDPAWGAQGVLKQGLPNRVI